MPAIRDLWNRVAAPVRGLANNTSLVNLIPGASIGREGCVTLGGMLARNSSLTSLNLNYSGIRGAGVESLLQGLEMNGTLRTLGLQNAAVDEKGAQALIHYAARNRSTPLLLELTSNKVDLQWLDDLRALNKSGSCIQIKWYFTGY
ncbi:MAG: hypothetical protein JWQ23_711 [Herminiimonas sp.]|nr:hypothetical protein [Herminiimonas sp.]